MAEEQKKMNWGLNPSGKSPLPWRVFDPGPKDPYREIYIVDADNHCVTTTGCLLDPQPLSLENANFIVAAVNATMNEASVLGQMQRTIDGLKAQLESVKNEV